jgi:Ca2+-binding EF-hand superfamily protein
MKHVDLDGDGLVSKKEYLVKIRKDRKFADFLKMPVRVRQADGTLERFIEMFQAINCSRTGRFTTNELAYYLGCSQVSEATPEVTSTSGGKLQ